MDKIEKIIQGLRHWAEFGQHWDKQGNSIAMNKFLKESASTLENLIGGVSKSYRENRMLRYGPIPHHPEEIRVVGKFIHLDEVNDKVYAWCEVTGDEDIDDKYYLSCVGSGKPYWGECIGSEKIGDWLLHVVKKKV